MTPEAQSTLINLTIGAFIGFLFSAVSTYIKDHRNRQWHKEDNQEELRRELIRKRASEAEAAIEAAYDICQRIAFIEFELIEKPGITDEFIANMEPLIAADVVNVYKKLSSVISVGDEELIKGIGELGELSNAENKRLLAIAQNRYNPSFDMDYEQKLARAYLERIPKRITIRHSHNGRTSDEYQ